MFIVEPSFVIRTIDKEVPLALDDQGNLIKSPEEIKQDTEKSELKIPFSLKNIKVLCSYPLKGKENMPVFDKDCNAEVFKQCNTCPDKMSVYFMRRHVVDRSRGTPYSMQKEFVEKKGFKVTSLRIRVLFDAVHILKEGTCPDAKDPKLTYSRHPEAIRSVMFSVVGGFVPRIGLDISNIRHDYGFDHIGVVPGRPAEVSGH